MLGLRAKEIHVCGGLEALEVVKTLVEDAGDEFEVKKYERLSPLTLVYYNTLYSELDK